GTSLPQVIRPADPEIAVQHGLRVVAPADLAGARTMVTPGLIPDPLRKRLLPLDLRPRHQFAHHVWRALHHTPGEAHGLHHGSDIGAIGVVTFLEVMEVHIGAIERIRADQLDLAGRVAGVPLEDGPGEGIPYRLEVREITRKVALETGCQCKDEEVGIGLARPRSPEEGKRAPA